MLFKDAVKGRRVKTPFGLATITGKANGVDGERYIHVDHDERVPGRQNMHDRRGSYHPRSLTLIPAAST